MSIKKIVKSKVSNKFKKIIFKAVKPFLPFIIVIIGIFFAICNLIDAIFIQETQSDDSILPEAQLAIKKSCIDKAEYLNTCNNYISSEKTNYLLDIDSRETDKQIEWSHLYSIMAFHNMTNNTNIDEYLLNKVSNYFESTFTYERIPIKIETTKTDENGNTSTSTEEKTAYILIESDSIIGHYKYNYEEKTIEKNNIKTTTKIFKNEELIGEKYGRLKKYLKEELRVSNDDIEYDIQIVIQAATGYYTGEENTSWLQSNSSNSTIITDGKGLVPKGMFTWPIPNYTRISSEFGMRVHPITGAYKLHSGTDVSAPMRIKLYCNGRWNSYQSKL